MIEIKRTKLLENFLTMIKRDHLLLIGDPGAGKSWLMAKAKESLVSESITAVLIKADEIHVENMIDFQKALGITDRTIEEILNYKSAGKRSYLFIDALDAARSEIKQSVFRRFIQLILSKCPDWTIVASIRSYDAKHSRELLSIFPIATIDAPDQFIKADVPYRHLFVPKLTDGEIDQVLEQQPSLRAIYQQLSSQQKYLFQNPFSLWLFDKLIEERVPLHQLSMVQRIVQLLGIYWEYRIEKKDDNASRKVLLKQAVEKMTASNLLSVNEQDLAMPQLDLSLKGLKSDHILVPTSNVEQRLIFEHNVIFDYAVSRLMVSEIPSESLKYLESDLRIPLFLRPSIEFYFSRLWYKERELFWDVFWYFVEHTKSRYISILPVVTFVQEIRKENDFVPLIQKLNALSQDSIEYKKIVSLVDLIFRVFQGVIETATINRDEAWIDFINALLPYLNLTFIDSYVSTLQIFVNKLAFWPDEKKVRISSVVITILKWAWNNPQAGGANRENLLRMIAARVVPLACEVYGLNKTEFRKILEAILKRIGPDSNLTEVFSLTHNIEKIWPYDPDFACSIYASIFGYKETSNAETVMSRGVLSLTSNRRQDYEGCLYVLAEKFPKYLKSYPLSATEAMVKSVNAGLKLSRLATYSRGELQTFQFNDKIAKYLEDGSESFDKYLFREEDHLKILTAYRDYLFEQLENNQFDPNVFAQMLEMILSLNEVAVVWRHLLKLGNNYPEKLIAHLYPLLLATPILINSATTYVAGKFINVSYEYIGPENRKKIETKILSLEKEKVEGRNLNWLRDCRNRLLASIPYELLSEDESKAILKDLQESNKVPSPEAGFQRGGFTREPYTEREWLKEKGVDVNEDNNKSLLSLSEPVKDFADKNLNTTPALDEYVKIIPSMNALYADLNDPSKHPHDRVKEQALTHLAAALSRMLRDDESFTNSEIILLASEVFDLASQSASPHYNSKHDEEFDHPSWSPAPRIEAAEGIMLLVRKDQGATKKNFSIVQLLANDPVPSVRYHIAQRITLLYHSNHELMWQIAETISSKEKTSGVLMGLATSLSRLAGKHTDKVLDIYGSICEKMSLEQRKKAGVHNDPCISTFVGLYVVFTNERANKILEQIEENPIEKAHELSQEAISAINYLSAGLKDNEKDDSEAIRERTRKLLCRILQAAKKGFETLETKFKSDWPEERKNSLKDLYDSVEIIARWLAFKQEDKHVAKHNRLKFYNEIKPLIWEVISITNAPGALLHASTAHNLMEMCNKCLSFDPPGIIEIAEAICRTSAPYGYTFDSLAIGQLVELVESYLADYKEYLQEEKNLKHLTNLLELFIVAGWPQAIQLAIKLETIWR